MGIPYRARVNERWFLNLPGFHGGAYVVAYAEDTSISALRVFRTGVEAEFEHYDRRERELWELRNE
jgi:hypothetical protein